MRKVTSAAIALAMAATLAACSSEEDVPTPQAGTQAEYAVSQEKYTEIVTEVQDSLTVAGDANDPELLNYRIGEPLKTQLTADYKLASVAPSFNAAPIALSADATPLLSGKNFPRTMMSVDLSATASSVGTLSVWSQANPRSNYQIRAAVDLFPDPPAIDLTSSLNDVTGYPDVSAADYLVDPATVLSQYATYLNDREMGDVTFNADDPFYIQSTSQVDSLNESLGDIGEAEMTYTAVDGAPFTVATTDGGLVLVGEIRYNMVITGDTEAGTVRLGSYIGALYEEAADGIVEIDQPVTAAYSTSVAFYIPPAGSETQVHVLGASTPSLLSVTKEGDEE